MAGQKDGWTDRSLDRQIAGWKEGRTDRLQGNRRLNRQKVKKTDGWPHGHLDRLTRLDRWLGRQKAGQTYIRGKQTARQTNGWTNRRLYIQRTGQTDCWADRLMDRQTDGQTDWWANRRLDRQTSGNKNRLLNRQTAWQTDARQTEELSVESRVAGHSYACPDRRMNRQGKVPTDRPLSFSQALKGMVAQVFFTRGSFSLSLRWKGSVSRDGWAF